MTRPSCRTCRHWTPHLVAVSPPWMAARPTWGLCADRDLVISEYATEPCHTPRPPEEPAP